MILQFVLVAGICVLYEKRISFGHDANSIGVPAVFQYCTAMILQQLCNNSAITLQQLCNNSATTLQQIGKRSATNSKGYPNAIRTHMPGFRHGLNPGITIKSINLSEYATE